jgi:hypothetical protein
MNRFFPGGFSAKRILLLVSAAWFLCQPAGPDGSPAALGWSGQPSAGASAPQEVSLVPRFSHVLVIVMENKEFEQVVGNPRMPNFNRWARRYALLTQYYAVTHPSLPNYIALISGDFFGIESDCIDCTVNARSLPDLLEASERTWKAYAEGLPVAGFTGSRSGGYVKKHNPFVYFEAIYGNPDRCKRSVVPLSQLKDDLEKDTLPDFAFVVPDLCHSSHDCDVEVTDAWLGRVVNSILRSPAFDQNSLLVLTFDEGTTFRSCCGSPPLARGGSVATVLISPLVKAGCRDKTPYSHYSLLKTIAAAWELEELGHASSADTNLITFPWLGESTRQ